MRKQRNRVSYAVLPIQHSGRNAQEFSIAKQDGVHCLFPFITLFMVLSFCHSRLPTWECWTTSSHQWKLKNRDGVCLLKTKLLHWLCLLISAVANNKDGHCIFKTDLALNPSKFSHPSLRQDQKCTIDYSYYKRLIDVSIPNFKPKHFPMFRLRKRLERRISV